MCLKYFEIGQYKWSLQDVDRSMLVLTKLFTMIFSKRTHIPFNYHYLVVVFHSWKAFQAIKCPGAYKRSRPRRGRERELRGVRHDALQGD